MIPSCNKRSLHQAGPLLLDALYRSVMMEASSLPQRHTVLEESLSMFEVRRTTGVKLRPFCMLIRRISLRGTRQRSRVTATPSDSGSSIPREGCAYSFEAILSRQLGSHNKQSRQTTESIIINLGHRLQSPMMETLQSLGEMATTEDMERYGYSEELAPHGHKKPK